MPHFHIPLQSGSDTILKLMKRRYLTKYYQSLIQRINNSIKNVCIGVDVIVGFPGESDELFNETVNFIKSLNISYLHVFTYSERDNTIAQKMNNVVPVQVRKYRSKVLRNLSDKKKRYFYQKNIGLIKDVLFENQVTDGYIYGFSDNYIKVQTKYKADLINTFQKVIIKEIEQNKTTYAKGALSN